MSQIRNFVSRCGIAQSNLFTHAIQDTLLYEHNFECKRPACDEVHPHGASYVSLLSQVSKSTIPTVVLESDVALQPHFETNIQNILSCHTSSRFAVNLYVMGEIHEHVNRRLLMSSCTLTQRGNAGWGTQGYLFSPGFVKHFVGKKRKSRLQGTGISPSDLELIRFCSEDSMGCFTVKTSLVQHTGLSSSLFNKNNSLNTKFHMAGDIAVYEPRFEQVDIDEEY